MTRLMIAAAIIALIVALGLYFGGQLYDHFAVMRETTSLDAHAGTA